jgi:predicted ATP-dependent endonuclease of OLD family
MTESTENSTIGKYFQKRRTRLKLTNFKAFGESVNIDIRPITLIFGANSSGKSSIIHSLLYTHQLLNVSHKLRPHDISFTELGGSLVDLGGYPHFLYKHDALNKLEIGLSFLEDGSDEVKNSIKTKELLSTSYTLFLQQNQDGHTHLVLKRMICADDVLVLTLEFDLDAVASGNEHPPKVTYGNHKEIETLVRENYLSALSILGPELIDSQSQENQAASSDWLQRLTENTEEYEIFKQMRHTDVFEGDFIGSERLRISSSELMENFFRISSGFLEQYFNSLYDRHEILRQFMHNKKNFKSIFNLHRRQKKFISFDSDYRDFRIEFLRRVRKSDDFFSSIAYLGPIRKIPARLFRDFEDVVLSDSDGSAAWQRLTKNTQLVNRINQTLQQLGINYELRLNSPEDALIIEKSDYDNLIESIENEMANNEVVVSEIVAKLRNMSTRRNGIPFIELVDKNSDTKVSHRDVGVGISQVLPILVNCYTDWENIVCVEQPELHLHPKLQGDLADVFIDTALTPKSNKTYIIETHSEHIIRRLMRRVREGKISKDDISIVYVEPGPNGSTVTPIRMDEDGDLIDEWPNGFFEEGFRDHLAGRQ